MQGLFSSRVENNPKIFIMKQNSQKILAWLYPVTDGSFSMAQDDLQLLLPEMTPGGRRSLLHYLRGKHLLRSERLENKTYISLTSHGKALSAAEFRPFGNELSDWSGVWAVVIFLSPPKSDEGFRYLRQTLLENHFVSLSRGVYLYPGSIPQGVESLLQELYVGAVSVLEAQKWLFGDEREFINEKYALNDLAEVYSGISREINQLLNTESQQKGLIEKESKQIYSVFERLFAVLGNDPGLMKYYYPQVPTAKTLLQRLQRRIQESIQR